jgi:hypothetical protein
LLKYHLSPKTGNAGVCKAKYKCAFGDIETEHYSSKELARAAYEEKMSTEATTFPKTLARVKIQSAEKFQEILQDYELKSPKLKPLKPTTVVIGTSVRALLTLAHIQEAFPSLPKMLKLAKKSTST